MSLILLPLLLSAYVVCAVCLYGTSCEQMMMIIKKRLFWWLIHKQQNVNGERHGRSCTHCIGHKTVQWNKRSKRRSRPTNTSHVHTTFYTDANVLSFIHWSMLLSLSPPSVRKANGGDYAFTQFVCRSVC